MMRYWRVLWLALMLVLLSSAAYPQQRPVITHYRPTFIAGQDVQGQLRVAIRSYQRDGVDYVLVVDPYTLATTVLPSSAFHRQAVVNPQLQNTPYLQALTHYAAPPYPLQNDGLTHAARAVDGWFLTVDMCPSRKPFETTLFQQLVTWANTNQQPFPLALSVSGKWIMTHARDFNWILAQQRAHKLRITWVDHSYTHAYDPKLPLQKNFLLQPGASEDEVLRLEQLLLTYDQTPSVFFRFPGLVSNKNWMLRLHALGLIAVGSDAWLAKDQQPKPGSVVLVHGNSNEPQGVKKLLPLLADPHNHWLPLEQAP